MSGGYGGKPSDDGCGCSASGGSFLTKLARLEFPMFAGGDPGSWFPCVEQFFEYQEVSEDQKVSLVAFHLEGEAN
ncbi:unnamed protein product [Linum trigynum]|uniref:Uncharacterized protein n=1 Tax=Linum trigynum TaxID=586398 RepID=A0AAV2D104_9ROSI